MQCSDIMQWNMIYSYMEYELGKNGDLSGKSSESAILVESRRRSVARNRGNPFTLIAYSGIVVDSNSKGVIMTYYLTEVNETYGSEKRLAITVDPIGVIKRSVEAESWLEAKVKLGFELTPFQKSLIK